MISPWQIGILLLIVVLLFGTSKLKNMGSDLGSALKGFKKAVKDEVEIKDDAKDADFEPLDKPVVKSNESATDSTVQGASQKSANKE